MEQNQKLQRLRGKYYTKNIVERQIEAALALDLKNRMISTQKLNFSEVLNSDREVADELQLQTELVDHKTRNTIQAFLGKQPKQPNLVS